MQTRMGDLWHIGIVVRSIDDTRVQLAENLGLIVGPTRLWTLPALHGTRTVQFDLKIAFTVGPAPYLEIIEATGDGGFFDLSNGNGGLHHIAFWGDLDQYPLGDPRGGCPAAGVEAVMFDPTGAPQSGYFQPVQGANLRVEVVTRQLTEEVTALLGGS